MPSDNNWLYADISHIAPEISALIDIEQERQLRKLIMIPSESMAPLAVRQALGSVFQNIYAEGYPPLRMTRDSEPLLLDHAHQLAYYRRYADRRFYKGAEYVHFVETLAQQRAASLFATENTKSDQIHVNVQALSGSAANLAVYDTLLEEGQTIMGMDLFQGGHLTHGSEFNISGKRYKVASYGVDPQTHRLDYDAILQLARQAQPKLIIAGFTSYPWAPDWKRFREIADSVGAFLMADVSHIAGLIAARVLDNPIELADVITFTTHKTLCGPRGAVIMTSNLDLGAMIDLAVFPGAQGGPHTNKFAAMAVAFKLAQLPEFKQLQRDILENAKKLSDCLQSLGVRVAYGGTDTHLLNIDLRSLPSATGIPLRGEMAARILDLAGIVTNKNTIPGDDLTALASGIRLGTPWITQIGLNASDMAQVAQIIHQVVSNIQPFAYRGLAGELPRGKIDLDTLVDARSRVVQLINKSIPQGVYSTGYPHFPSNQMVASHLDADHPIAIQISGWRAEHFLDEVCTANIREFNVDELHRSLLLKKDGSVLADALVERIANDEFDRTQFVVYVRNHQADSVILWLQGLADGYILFDDDLLRKVQGPVVIEKLEDVSYPSNWPPIDEEEHIGNINTLIEQYPSIVDMSKPYFIGCDALKTKSPSSVKFVDWQWDTTQSSKAQRTALHNSHVSLNGRMVPFAGWTMPVRYETSVLEEHAAVRQTAGLFDVAHMGVFDISGKDATAFLDVLTSNYVAWLDPGQSCYAYLLKPDGSVIDDVMIYCLERERYLMVVNAVNAEKDWAWMNAVNSGQVSLSRNRPDIASPGPVRLRDLKDPQHGRDCLVDMALQGPQSIDVLCELASNPAEQNRLCSLRKTELLSLELSQVNTIIARTGYTGEEFGFEIFAHPDDTPELWEAILTAGKDRGIIPAGLAARDSTRIEFGLPLYGNELEGPYSITPIEAGFPGYVKFHKPFFIGREAILELDKQRVNEILRFRILDHNVRVPKMGDPVVDRRGKVVGNVTSCSIDREGELVGLAYCRSSMNEIDNEISVFCLPRRSKEPDSWQVGGRATLPARAIVLSRFMEQDTDTPKLIAEGD
ncbi:MAG: glycine cleavage system aminomethyltransferase GcvT [Chloroflexota bacterium]